MKIFKKLSILILGLFCCTFVASATETKLYAAYGSNINLDQMAFRCPNAKVVGTSEIKDYKLIFRGEGNDSSWATIELEDNCTVPVLI